jgi:outer membrane protein assembly factor BamE (lipoprotein component of BamABCDE complex)
MIRRAFFLPLPILRPRAAALVLALGVLATGCNPVVDNLGNRTLKENVDQIQVGRTTKIEVQRLLGSPSNVASFDDNTWYYVSARQVQLAFLRPRTTEQSVLSIRFDQGGIVREVKQLGLEDAQATTYVDRTTPTRGGEPGVLRSLYDTLMRGPVGGARNKGSGTPRRGPEY